MKNNGEKEGIVLLDNQSPYSPLFYFDPLYQQYLQGYPILSIIQMMERQAKANNHILPQFPVINALDYSRMRADLCICMVNTATNGPLLEKVPHKTYGDFSAILYWILPPDGDARILINQKILEGINRDFDVLFADAYANMLGRFELRNMEEVLCEMLADEMGKNADDPAITKMVHQTHAGVEMYVLTNKMHCYGASAMCYPQEMQKAADMLKGDYVIIPSSLHELILLPFRKDQSLEVIREIIHEVNQEKVSPEEQLSGEVYVYSSRAKAILRGNEYLQREQIIQEDARNREARERSREDGRTFD
jgi:hypothetical protein